MSSLSFQLLPYVLIVAVGLTLCLFLPKLSKQSAAVYFLDLTRIAKAAWIIRIGQIINNNNLHGLLLFGALSDKIYTFLKFKQDSLLWFPSFH